ncbi:cysteine dioxygenase [Actinosynnema mirum]|uniref:Cysteine dioxygenase type I n=1 Tax=Actinosynnema mirum (strain ATCC 29888 / DSM 43827 / JCM 3225 / NBRC 14064 / NCIMB 13271 / NRRL B-12336 / IMRU 3971 / 101) TaxID=446462 RepID=C6WGB1_ACTMD|nr:cysteine dioxygenase family protein [Actinosynnema mirum]ACU39875.1 cysteine dioxygenase type I [Actinosynnema mirum DSM 43827]
MPTTQIRPARPARPASPVGEAAADLHPRFDADPLRALLHPGRDLWTPSQLRELTTSVASGFRAELTDLVRYTRPQRWWARLGLTEGVELWLLSWAPGQGTEPHDHGGAAGSFTVLEGELHEDFRHPGGQVGTATRRAGAALGFGAGRAHQVRNTSEANASSVHAYSPPLVPTRDYRSLWDIPTTIPPLPAHRLPLDRLRELADLEGP